MDNQVRNGPSNHGHGFALSLVPLVPASENVSNQVGPSNSNSNNNNHPPMNNLDQFRLYKFWHSVHEHNSKWLMDEQMNILQQIQQQQELETQFYQKVLRLQNEEQNLVANRHRLQQEQNLFEERKFQLGNLRQFLQEQFQIFQQQQRPMQQSQEGQALPQMPRQGSLSSRTPSVINIQDDLD